MLRIIETFNHLPMKILASPNSILEPGKIGQMTVKNNEVVLSLSDGLAPIGVIDDVQTDQTRKVVWNKVLNIPLNSLKKQEDKFIAIKKIKFDIQDRVITHSFTSTIPVVLDSKNRVIIILKGSELKSTTFCVSYAYTESHEWIDSLSDSKATVWFTPFIGESDMFDTSQVYKKYSNLYVLNGLFTTIMPTAYSECVGVVLEPPTAINGCLKFLWDPGSKIPVGKEVNHE